MRWKKEKIGWGALQASHYRFWDKDVALQLWKQYEHLVVADILQEYFSIKIFYSIFHGCKTYSLMEYKLVILFMGVYSWLFENG